MIAAVTAATTTVSTPWWVAPGVIAALIAAAMAVASLAVNGRRARQDRQRALFANALAQVSTYCEFPYMVRRRRHDDAAGERARISTELSAVQQRINHHRAVLRVEDRRVAAAYAELVDAARNVAGPAIRAGWDQPARTRDNAMHVTDVDLAPIAVHEERYLHAVGDHLALAPWQLRAGARTAAKTVRRAAGAARRRAQPTGAPQPAAE